MRRADLADAGAEENARQDLVLRQRRLRRELDAGFGRGAGDVDDGDHIGRTRLRLDVDVGIDAVAAEESDAAAVQHRALAEEIIGPAHHVQRAGDHRLCRRAGDAELAAPFAVEAAAAHEHLARHVDIDGERQRQQRHALPALLGRGQHLARGAVDERDGDRLESLRQPLRHPQLRLLDAQLGAEPRRRDVAGEADIAAHDRRRLVTLHGAEAPKLAGEVEGGSVGGGEIERAGQRQAAFGAVAGVKILQHQPVAVADEIEADAFERRAPEQALITAVAQRQPAAGRRRRHCAADRHVDGEVAGQAILAQRQEIGEIGQFAIALEAERQRALRRQVHAEPLRIERQRRAAVEAQRRVLGAGDATPESAPRPGATPPRRRIRAAAGRAGSPRQAAAPRHR